MKISTCVAAVTLVAALCAAGCGQDNSRHDHSGETPTPVNPLGVKGAGETGTIAATPAVVNAVVDALSGLGVDHIEVMPLTSERVWKTVQTAKSRK